jgi:hypothetical protein
LKLTRRRGDGNRNLTITAALLAVLTTVLTTDLMNVVATRVSGDRVDRRLDS